MFTGGSLLFEKIRVDATSINNAGFTIAKTSKGLLFLNGEGLQYTDGTRGAELLESSAKIHGLIGRIYVDKIDKSYAVADETKQEYHLLVPVDGGGTGSGWPDIFQNTNNYLITWNWKYDTWRVRRPGYSILTWQSPASVLGIYTDDLIQVPLEREG